MAWTKILDALPPTAYIFDLCVFNDKVYAIVGGFGSARLFEWNGIASVWSEVATEPSFDAFRSLIVFQGDLYVTGYSNALLYRFTDPGVVLVATNPYAATIVYNMAEFQNYIYGTADMNGYILRWDPLSPSSWYRVNVGGAFFPRSYSIVTFESVTVPLSLFLGDYTESNLRRYTGTGVTTVATSYLSETSVRLLFVFNGELYGFTGPSGFILRWDQVSAWVYVATIPNTDFAIRAVEAEGKVYLIGAPASGNVIVYSFNGSSVIAETISNPGLDYGLGLVLFNGELYVAGEGSDETALFDSGIEFEPPVPSNNCTIAEVANIALFGFNNPITTGLLATFGYLCFEGIRPDVITDYCEKALDRLAEQFEDKINLATLICSFTAEVQELEFVIYNLFIKRSLDSSVGVQLDGIGEIVGKEREPGQSDGNYRSAIRIQIGINNGSGEPETMISAFKELTNANNILYQENCPAGVVMYSDGGVIPNLMEEMEKIAPAGVNLELHVSGTPPEDTFAFAPEGGVPDPEGLGFEDPPDLSGVISEKII